MAEQKVTHDGNFALKHSFNPDTNSLRVEAGLSLNSSEDSITSVKPSANLEVNSGEEINIELFDKVTIYCDSEISVSIKPTEKSPSFKVEAEVKKPISIAGHVMKITADSPIFICLRG